ncbi:head maturation protease, ClpP-related [Bacillus sp. FJAT-49736]|uniref:head maturation protease, ClpP-related n=1 Tax=Bacillus sp. FJAT-49736 TaxID=2833582 RepID=UPI001BC9B2F8|nr:head maturation protease, ClpP-related [Bacillus sp. FJAT-49736]MBS4171936.1 Clp protease ClpP [Bacillus sp. FJAT-49736]
MKKIDIKGVIVFDEYKEIYDWFGIENTSVSDVVNSLPEDNSPIEIIINSPGGMVDAGSEIYSRLKDYAGESTSKIFALAASAASIIAMGTDQTLIAPTAQIMIHNVSGSSNGDYRELIKEASILENYNKAIANAYMLKTGKSQDEVLALMNKESWFTAQEAVEHGFVDGILFDIQLPKTASLGATLLPQAVVDKTRQMLKQQTKNDFSLSKQQLDLIVETVTNNLKHNINLKQNINMSNEPTPPAPMHSKRKGFIF